MSDDEMWRQIDRFPNYAVSNRGRVKRLTSRTRAKAGAMLSQHWRGGTKGDRGYLAVQLTADGQSKMVSLHVLVAEAFIGKRPDGHVPNHKNGDRADNCEANLEWVTQSRNVRHAYELGLADAKGEANGQAKMTDESVRRMRRLATGKRGEYTALAHQFGISPKQAADIIKRNAWAHVA